MQSEVADMSTTYADYAIDLAVDAVAIFLMAYVLYFRRHRRADLLLAYVTLNIGIFVAMSLLGTVRVDIALGFGLFAILSIIRLRSSTVTQQEVAYYFVALVMGLVNGMDLADRVLVVAVNVLLLLTMFVVDSRPLRERARRMDVTLDVVHSDDASLVADLERRLGGQVMHHVITDIDYVRDTMVVDVRFRASRPEPQQPVGQPQYHEGQYQEAQYQDAQYQDAQYGEPQYGEPQYAQQYAQQQYAQQYNQQQYNQQQYAQQYNQQQYAQQHNNQPAIAVQW
jgi:hypothetical protein